MDALHRDHGEQLSEQMRIAALVQMLPRDICDMVRQSLDEGSTNRGIRDKFRNLVSNRVTLEETARAPWTSEPWLTTLTTPR